MFAFIYEVYSNMHLAFVQKKECSLGGLKIMVLFHQNALTSSSPAVRGGISGKPLWECIAELSRTSSCLLVTQIKFLSAREQQKHRQTQDNLKQMQIMGGCNVVIEISDSVQILIQNGL